jgi:hypothetical protein
MSLLGGWKMEEPNAGLNAFFLLLLDAVWKYASKLLGLVYKDGSLFGPMFAKGFVHD